MENVEKLLQALFIGISLASVVLQTCRYRKAIELFTECLEFLNKHASSLEAETLKHLSALVYCRLSQTYFYIGDSKNCSENREKASFLYPQMGGGESSAECFAKPRDEHVPKTYDSPDNEEDQEINESPLSARNYRQKIKEAVELDRLSRLALSRFKYSEARCLLEKLAELWGELEDREQEGNALFCLGELHKSLDEYDQAQTYIEKALIMAEEDEDIYTQGVAIGRLGTLCNFRGDYIKAKCLRKKALEISVKIGDKKGEIVDNRFLSGVLLNLGEFKEALDCCRKALTLNEEVGDINQEASAYSDLGDVHRKLKDFEMAEHCYKRAIEIYQETGNLESEESENARLGDLYHFLCKYDLALKSHERSLILTKQMGNKRGEARQYFSLEAVYKDLGDYRMVKEYCEQALTINTEENHVRGQAIDYGNLGTIHQRLGDYKTGYELHQKALEIKTQIDFKEGMPANYLNLGHCCKHLGEFAKAKEFWRLGLDIARTIGDSLIESNIIASLAFVEYTIGEYESANAHYQQALHISQEAGDLKQQVSLTCKLAGLRAQSQGDEERTKADLERCLQTMKRIGDKDGESDALGNLGILYTFLGKHREAIEYNEQALDIVKEINDKKGEMVINNNLGQVYLYENEFKKAFDCFSTALSISQTSNDLIGESRAYCNIALVCLARNDELKAFSALSASIKLLEKTSVIHGESETFQIGFADRHNDPYRLMVVVLLILGNIDQALSVSELGRARSLARQMEAQYSAKPLPSFDPFQWIDPKNAVRKQSYTCLSFYFYAWHIFHWILKANMKTTCKEMSSRQWLSADSQPQRDSFQEKLKDLANKCYREFSLLPGERCEDRYLVLDDKHSEARSPTKSEGSPEPHQSLNACKVEEKNEGGSEEELPLKMLYKVTIAPVADLLEGSDEIVVVPDRSLYRVPFSALMNEKGEFLAEMFRIRYTPSLTTLKLIQESPADYHSESGVLLVGDPAVGIITHQGSKLTFSPLPCAKKEVEMIGKMLNVQPLTGKDATKEVVLQKIHSVSLIHIAAHGEPERGHIALAPSNREKNDFLLTMADISAVRLRTKLVVLSCCHSGKGHIKAEGVVGIARAFLGSGARSVLASLWAVDDDATMAFMEQFYQHLVNGKSASESLHESMKWMRENPDYSEVRKWAPFVLIGDDVSFQFAK